MDKIKKDDLVQLKIEDFSSEGLGIGRVNGMAVFVKDTVIGDEIQAKIIKSKKTYAYGRLMQILTPSPNRVEPVCPVARQCGGCQLQAMSYEAQLRFKEKKVRGNLQRIGGFESAVLDEVMEPIIGMEDSRSCMTSSSEDMQQFVQSGILRYRNKAQFPIGTDKEGNLTAGFYAGRTHSIIDHHDCALGVEQNKTILELVLDFMRHHKITAYDETTGKGLVRHVMTRCGFTTGQIMVCIITNGRKLPFAEELITKLTQIPGMTSIVQNINCEKTNVILGSEVICLWGQDYIEDYIGIVKYRISALSFYQVNPVQTEKLYQTALDYANLQGNETVWDLYCGIGTISLFLAQRAKQVYGVEIVPPAIEDARKNAALNQITNAAFFVGKAEEVLPEKYKNEQISADVIVVDPPRKGCEQSVLDTMIAMAPDRIVYVSCDSATLARDLKYLCENGYELKQVRPTDMFGMSVHVETVVLLSRKKVDGYVSVDLDVEKIDSKSGTGFATYKELKAYIKEQNGLSVSSLNIAQIKDKCGIEKRKNYYKGDKGHKVPIVHRRKKRRF